MNTEMDTGAIVSMGIMIVVFVCFVGVMVFAIGITLYHDWWLPRKAKKLWLSICDECQQKGMRMFSFYYDSDNPYCNSIVSGALNVLSENKNVDMRNVRVCDGEIQYWTTSTRPCVVARRKS